MILFKKLRLSVQAEFVGQEQNFKIKSYLRNFNRNLSTRKIVKVNAKIRNKL